MFCGDCHTCCYPAWSETILSDEIPKKWKTARLFQKFKCLTKVMLYWGENWTTVFIFFLVSWGCNYLVFAEGKYCYYHQSPVLQVSKNIFTCSIRLFKITSRAHCAITWRKRCQGVCFVWVLTTLPVTLENKVKLCNQMIFQREQPNFLQKTQILEQVLIVIWRENEPVIFYCWFQGCMASSQWKVTLCH